MESIYLIERFYTKFGGMVKILKIRNTWEQKNAYRFGYEQKQQVAMGTKKEHSILNVKGVLELVTPKR